MKTEQSWIRRGRRTIRMVSELHRMGHQLLRIQPYEYPLAWRCTVAPKAVFSRINGALIPKQDYNWPTYTSASENRYFEWEDATTDDARALAQKFTVRFPDVVEQGKGRDWEYAGWLVELLGILERNPACLPIIVAEDLGTPPQLLNCLPLRRYGGDVAAVPPPQFPLPPKGLAFDKKSKNTEASAGGWS